MNRTGIEYLTHTWSPIAMRCTPVSEGCTNCWHIKRAKMLTRNTKISLDARLGYSGSGPVLIPERLDEPLKLKKPSIIGVQLMGDLFYLLFAWIDIIMARIAATPRHTYIILTKRPKRMLEYFTRYMNPSGSYHLYDIANSADLVPDSPNGFFRLPLKNLYLGVSVESNKYRWRVEELIKIPGKHFISYEPALGPLNLCVPYGQGMGDLLIDNIDGVIAGCESGPGRRPAKNEWFRDLKNQCVDAGVPFFLKQMAQFCMLGDDQRTKVVKMPMLDGEIWNALPF